jgi:hypothetical protein
VVERGFGTLLGRPHALIAPVPSLDHSSSPRTWLILASCLLAVGGVGTGWFFRHSLKEAFLGWRADGLVRESSTFATAGDWEAAQRQALAAHQLTPLRYRPREAWFQASRHTGPEDLLPAALSVASHPEVPDSIRLEALRAIVEAGHFPAFLHLYRQLPAPLRERDETVLLVTDFLIGSDRSAEARTLIEARQQQIPAAAQDRRLTQRLISALLQPDPSQTEAGQRENTDRAHRLISELAKAPGGTRDAIFRTALTQAASLPLKRMRPDLLPADAAEWLESGPDATDDSRLLAERIRFASETEPLRKDRLDATVARFQSTAPEALAAWLFSLDQTGRILEVCDEARGRERLSLYLWRLRALEQAVPEQPQAVLDWLKTPHAEMNPADVHAARAGMQIRLGQRTEALKSWEEVIVLTDVDPIRYPVPKFYALALSQGLVEVATRLIVNTAAHPGAPLPASEALDPVLAHLQEKGRLQALQSLTASLLQREPGNLVLRNNYAYLCFVTGENREEAVPMAEDLVRADPTILAYRTTLALGYLVSGQPARALEALAVPNLDWNRATPADHAILAATLERNGRTVEAAEEQKKFALSSLSPDERRVLTPGLGAPEASR